MRKTAGLMAVWIALCCLAAAQAGDVKKTVSGELDANVKTIESELVPAIEAMPEDKFAFVPTGGEFKNVRTFAQQAKHIAAVNYLVAAAILGEKPPVDTGGEKGPEGVASKADVVKFVKESFVYAHKAVASINDGNAVTSMKSPFGDGMTTRVSLASVFAWHGFDHYGQMVVYLRMNGIVPPASR